MTGKLILKYLPAILIVFLFSCKKDRLNWQQVEKLESHTTSRLNRIIWIDDKICIVSGGEKFQKAEILRSADMGQTWTLSDHPEAGKGLYGFDRSRWGKLYMTGFDAKLLYSTNNGASWQFHQISTWKNYVALSFATEDKCFLISKAAYIEGSIDQMDKDFNVVKSKGFDFALNDIHMVDEQTGYVAAYGAVLKTEDGGDNWKFQPAENDNFLGMQVVSANEVWVCGYNGSIFHTTDGGANWAKSRNGNDITIPRYRLQDILFTDAHHGYAIGEKGLVIYTDDGGNHWMEYKKFTDHSLLDIAVCPDGKLLVCGENGSLYRLSPM